jgi:hypothetical protein
MAIWLLAFACVTGSLGAWGSELVLNEKEATAALGGMGTNKFKGVIYGQRDHRMQCRGVCYRFRMEDSIRDYTRDDIINVVPLTKEVGEQLIDVTNLNLSSHPLEVTGTLLYLGEIKKELRNSKPNELPRKVYTLFLNEIHLK